MAQQGGSHYRSEPVILRILTTIFIFFTWPSGDLVVRLSALSSSQRTDTRWLHAAEHDSWQALGKRPFALKHRLAGHPLFDLDHLAAIAKDDRILTLADRNDWIKISNINRTSKEYADLLNDLIRDLETMSGESIALTNEWCGLTVFLNSPGLKVPYHFDHEMNFLMQIRGTKTVDLFDQNDRTVLTEREIEQFYRDNVMAGCFHQGLEHRQTRFILRAGDGVHHPPLAPHRIYNGDDVSVSASLFYTTPDINARAHIYQVNAILRQFKLAPTAPGHSPRVDRLKIRLMRAISRRRPSTQREMIFSGIRRVDFPSRVVKKLTRMALRKSTGTSTDVGPGKP